MATYTSNLMKDITVTDPPEGSTTMKELNDSDREIKRVIAYKDTIIAKTAAYTLTYAEEICTVSASGGAVTITLPTITTVSSSTVTKRYIVVKTDSSTNAVTVDTSSSDTINGAASITLARQYDCAIFYGFGGTDWYNVSANTAQALVSSNDTTRGYLNGKLVAGNHVTFTEGTDGGNETLTIAGDSLALRDKARNLVVTRTNVTTVAVTADELVLQTTAGVAKRFASVSESIAITTSGASGLDTGAEAPSTWYYIWIVAKTDGTINGLLSTATAIGSITFPSGYTYAALVGAVYNDSSSDFRNFYQQGTRCDLYTPIEVVTNGTATSYAQVDCSATIPDTAKKVNGYALATDGGTNFNLYIAGWDGSAGFGEFIVVRGTGGEAAYGTFSVQAVSSDITYKVSEALTGSNCDITITGWEYE